MICDLTTKREAVIRFSKPHNVQGIEIKDWLKPKRVNQSTIFLLVTSQGDPNLNM